MAIDVAGDLGRILSDAAGPGLDATYRQVGHWDVSLRVMQRQGAPVDALQDPHIRAGCVQFVVAASAVDEPRAGDRLTVGSDIYTVQGVPVRVARGARWLLDTWPIDALPLDTEIVLQRNVSEPNAFGEVLSEDDDGAVWHPIATVMASRVPVSVAEQLRAGRVEGSEAAVFTCRTDPRLAGLTSADRVLEGALGWNILGVERIARGEWLEITAERRS